MATLARPKVALLVSSNSVSTKVGSSLNSDAGVGPPTVLATIVP
jgi:hypothetical protein